MKRKHTNIRWMTLLLCCIMLTVALSANAEQTQQASNTTSRSSYVELAEELRIIHQQNPDDTKAALAYAEKLTQMGDVDEASSVLDTISEADAFNPQATYLRAVIAYLRGDYEQAEAEYEKLLHDYPDYKAVAERGLEYVYYQTNQYQKTQGLSGENASETGIYEMMQAFGDRKPYVSSWANEKKEAVVPFIVTDPLPLVELEINGEKKNFLIDTGASESYVNESVAEAMNIQPIASTVGEYAGGIKVESKFGILDSMKLNDAILESVPIVITNMDHFAPMYDVELSGIIGTGVFRQFHVTMDYINGALILTPRGENKQAQPDEVEVPFIMGGTHFFLSKATINGVGVNLFPDSGLFADVGLLLPNNTMEYASIPLPETTAAGADDVGGLGGTDYSTGYFTTNTFQMGNLPVVTNMEGLYGVFPEVYYFNEEIGVFVDGIISHVYLKDFVWTLDFDSMTMTFSKG